MLHHRESYRSLNSIVQVFISSLDVMLSMSSQLDTYIAEVQDGGTLRSGMPARVALHGLLRT